MALKFLKIVCLFTDTRCYAFVASTVVCHSDWEWKVSFNVPAPSSLTTRKLRF